MSHLPPWHELVCSAVDGELTPQERKRLKEILRSVPEARKLLREYKSDSKVLASLPVPPVPCDFAAEFKRSRGMSPVISTGKDGIFTDGLISVKNRMGNNNSILVASLVALAFSALLFAGAGVFWGLANDTKYQASKIPPSASQNRLERELNPETTIRTPELQGFGLTNRPNPSVEEPENLQKSAIASDLAPNPRAGLESWILPEPKPTETAKSLSGRQDGEAAGKPATETSTKSGEGNSTLLTAPFSNPGSLVEAKLIVPKWVAWEEDDFKSEVRKLVSERGKNPGPMYIEVPCNDSILVTANLVEVLKSRKLGVVIDRLAQDRLTQKSVRTHFAVCLEIGSSDDLEQILKSLNSRVNQAGGKSPISPLGKGLAFLPPNAENPAVFNGIHDRIATNVMPKTVADLEKATADSIAVRAGKNAAAKKLLLPQANSSGGLDAVFLAQSPYYPEVRSTNNSPEVTTFRQLWKSGPSTPRQTVFLFLRQLLL